MVKQKVVMVTGLVFFSLAFDFYFYIAAGLSCGGSHVSPAALNGAVCYEPFTSLVLGIKRCSAIPPLDGNRFIIFYRLVL